MKCLGPACNREGILRGLCKYDYEALATLVRGGFFTWDELIAKGWALEVKPHRGRAKHYSEEEIVALQKAKHPNGVPSREAFIELIGGSLSVLSKQHRKALDMLFPVQNHTLCDPNC